MDKELFDSIDNINKKKWDYHMNVNLWAPIFLIKEFKKNLLKNTKFMNKFVVFLLTFFVIYSTILFLFIIDTLKSKISISIICLKSANK